MSDSNYAVNFKKAIKLKLSANATPLEKSELNSSENLSYENEINNDEYVIASVQIQPSNYMNTNKLYAFMCFDKTISIGDKVVCDTSNGYVIGTVKQIMSKQKYDGPKATREIAVKFNSDEFKAAAKLRARKNELITNIKSKINDYCAEHPIEAAKRLSLSCQSLSELVAEYENISEE